MFQIDLAEAKEKKKEEARQRLRAMMAAQNRTVRGRRAPPTSNAQTPMELCKLEHIVKYIQ